MEKTNVSFLPRLIASLIDNLLLSLLPLFGVYYLSTAVSISDLFAKLIIATAFVFLPMGAIKMFYAVIALSNYGKTIGKAVVNIKVTDGKGKLLHWKWAFFREVIAKSVSTFLFGAGYWWIIKDKQNLAWHDMLAETTVAKTDKQGKENVEVGAIAAVFLLAVYVFMCYSIYTKFANNYPLIEGFKMLFAA